MNQSLLALAAFHRQNLHLLINHIKVAQSIRCAHQYSIIEIWAIRLGTIECQELDEQLSTWEQDLIVKDEA